MEEETTPIQDIIYIIKNHWMEIIGGIVFFFVGFWVWHDDHLWPVSLLWK